MIKQNVKNKVTIKGNAYDVIFHIDPDDGGFWVECPSLSSGCASQGDTVEEALEMIKDAIKGHLEIVAEKNKDASGRVNVRPS